MEKGKDSKSHKKLDPTTRKMIAGITGAVLVILVAVLMLIESQDGKLTVKNNTDLKLEYYKANFVGTEGNIDAGVDVKNIEAKKSYTKTLKPIELSDNNYEIRFKFENNKELIVDAGIFSDVFEGDINVVFNKTNDPNIINMKVKAQNGLLPSKYINCNEVYKINLKEGTFEN